VNSLLTLHSTSPPGASARSLCDDHRKAGLRKHSEKLDTASEGLAAGLNPGIFKSISYSMILSASRLRRNPRTLKPCRPPFFRKPHNLSSHPQLFTLKLTLERILECSRVCSRIFSFSRVSLQRVTDVLELSICTLHTCHLDTVFFGQTVQGLTICA